MRRTLFFVMLTLEVVLAVGLVVLAFRLPEPTAVEHHLDEVEQTTRQTAAHVDRMRDQVREMRRLEVHALADRLQKQTRTVAATLRARQVDFESVQTLGGVLKDVSRGLDNLSSSLDPEAVGKLGKGLGTTADYLDTKVAPAAAATAERLESSSKAMQENARRLEALLKSSSPDLQAVKEVHDSLERFSTNMDRMGKVLRLERFDRVKEGVAGLETSLSTGASQVERLAGYTYPAVQMQGLKPVVSQRPFWPQGETIADGMRKAADGVKAAGEELDGMAKELPRLRESLDEGKKIADRTRAALALALRDREKIEPFLKEAPAHAARLAEELPKLATDLARVLREAERLKEIAGGLREAEKGIQRAVASWPELKQTFGKSAKMLTVLGEQLEQAVEHRHDYEAALGQTVEVADSLGVLLPVFAEQMDQQLVEQERTLDDVGRGIDRVSEALPAFTRSTVSVLETARLIVWLLAAFVLMHVLYQGFSAVTPQTPTVDAKQQT